MSADSLPFNDSDQLRGQARNDTGIIPGDFHLWAADDPAGTDTPRLRCRLGPHAPYVSRGYGGWTQIQRAGRWAASVWPGGETPAFTISLRLEHKQVTSPDAATKMRVLERLCGWDTRDRPPPVVQFDCNAVHHDYAKAQQNEWVCESLDWDSEEMLFTDRGTLIRADATIVLGLYVVPKLEVTKAKGFARRELRVGWDLRDFAKHYLGDAKRWKDVVELNRDNPKCPTSPSVKLSKGVFLLVPPRERKATQGKK